MLIDKDAPLDEKDEHGDQPIHSAGKAGSKGQLISEAIFLGFKFPKKQTKLKRFCLKYLASKMGQVERNQDTLQLGLITIIICN